MNEARNTYPELAAKPRRHFLLIKPAIRLVREKPLGAVGGIIVLVMLIVGVFADFLAPHGIYVISLPDRLQPPSVQYPLGTDDLGRDVFSRIIHGARISMIVGLAGAAITVLVATIIGIPSGFFGGKFDLIAQRFVDARLCFPWLFLILTTIALIGQGMIQVIVVLGVVFGISYSRVVRSAVIGIKENVYLDAAVAIGCTPTRTLTHHVLPNITAPIIIIFTVSMGYMILSEATLSFLGYGIPPPTPSWGGMLTLGGRQYMLIAPWLAIWPGLALCTAVFGVNMFGDALRDILDPRLRGGLGRYGRVKTKKSKTEAQGF